MLHDPLHVLNAGRVDRKNGRKAAPPTDATPTELREPLSALGLDWPVTIDVLKTRYKELAKRHHPDANGGDRAAEERLKTINRRLRSTPLPPESPHAAGAADGSRRVAGFGFFFCKLGFIPRHRLRPSAPFAVEPVGSMLPSLRIRDTPVYE